MAQVNRGSANFLNAAQSVFNGNPSVKSHFPAGCEKCAGNIHSLAHLTVVQNRRVPQRISTALNSSMVCPGFRCRSLACMVTTRCFTFSSKSRGSSPARMVLEGHTAPEPRRVDLIHNLEKNILLCAKLRISPEIVFVMVSMASTMPLGALYSKTSLMDSTTHCTPCSRETPGRRWPEARAELAPQPRRDVDIPFLVLHFPYAGPPRWAG